MYFFAACAKSRNLKKNQVASVWPACGHRVATVWPPCGHRRHPIYVRLFASSLALLLACLPARVNFARLLICPPACLLACWQPCISRVQQHLSSQVLAWQRTTLCKLIFRKLAPPSPPRFNVGGNSPSSIFAVISRAYNPPKKNDAPGTFRFYSFTQQNSGILFFLHCFGSGVCENNVGLKIAGWLCRHPPDPPKVQC